METCWLGSERGELGKEVFGNALGADGYGFENETKFHFFLGRLPCHPDRSARKMLTFHELSGAEWRDPEGVSSAMTASRRSHQTAGGHKSTPERNLLLVMAPI